MSVLMAEVPLWATPRWLPMLRTRLDVVEELRELQAPLLAELEAAQEGFAEVERRHAAEAQAARGNALARARSVRAASVAPSPSPSAMYQEAELQVAAEREARAVVALVGWLEFVTRTLTSARRPEVNELIEAGLGLRTGDPLQVDAATLTSFMRGFETRDASVGGDMNLPFVVSKARRLRDAAETVLQAGRVAA